MRPDPDLKKQAKLLTDHQDINGQQWISIKKDSVKKDEN